MSKISKVKDVCVMHAHASECVSGGKYFRESDIMQKKKKGCEMESNLIYIREIKKKAGVVKA